MKSAITALGQLQTFQMLHGKDIFIEAVHFVLFFSFEPDSGAGLVHSPHY
jgi:hypothetical protein